MSTVESVVLSTVQDFVRDGVLFTALDVSNKVKEALPLVRHREVRDVVRDLYAAEIESASYAKTPITVQLADGTTAEALLYHPLMDSWDLDAKYDAQKRAQTAVRPILTVQSSAPVPLTSTQTAGFSVGMKVQPGVVSDAFKDKLRVLGLDSSLSATVSAPTVAPVASPSRVLWDNLFRGQPSLFPIK